MIVRDRVYQAVSSLGYMVSAEDIAKKVKAHPAHVRQELAALYRMGKLQRKEARMPKDYHGKKPYKYYVDMPTAPVEQEPQDVKVMVGKTTMTVREARKIYDQLKLLFG